MFSHYYLPWPRLCQSLCVAWQKLHECEMCSDGLKKVINQKLTKRSGDCGQRSTGGIPANHDPSFLSGPQHHVSKNSAAAMARSQAPRLLQLPVLSPPLHPYVLRLLLVRCLRRCSRQAAANTADLRICQLQRDGETALLQLLAACCSQPAAVDCPL